PLTTSVHIPLCTDAPGISAAVLLYPSLQFVRAPHSHFHPDNATAPTQPAQSPAKFLRPPIDTTWRRAAPKCLRAGFATPMEMCRMPEAPPLRRLLLEKRKNKIAPFLQSLLLFYSNRR